MALYRYDGNVRREDGTTILECLDSGNVPRYVSRGQTVDLTAPQHTALAVYFVLTSTLVPVPGPGAHSTVVVTDDPHDGDILVYNEANTVWDARSVTAAGLGTSAVYATGEEFEVPVWLGELPDPPVSLSRVVFTARRPCRVTSAVLVPSGSQAVSGGSNVYDVTLRKGGGGTPYGARSYDGEYRQKIVDAGAVAYYPLTDLSGTTAENVIGADGTYVGTPSLAQPGPFIGDDALGCLFDGVDDQVTMGASLTLGNTFTYECWVNPTVAATVSARQTIIGTDDSAVLPALELGSGNSVASTVPEGSLAFAFASTFFGFSGVASPFVRTSDWNHVAARRTGTVAQGGRYEEFINGKPSGSVTALADLAGTAVDFRIGRRRWTTTPTQYLNASLAHVAIYPTALTPEQLDDHAGIIARKSNRNTATTGPVMPGGAEMYAGRPWPFTAASFHADHSVLKPGDTVILDISSGGAPAALGDCNLVLGIQPLRENLTVV